MDPHLLPDNIRRLMDPKQRKALGLQTNEEIDEGLNAKEELEHQKMLEAWCRQRDLPIWHSRTDKKTTNKLGTPDFCLVYRNRVLVVEIKGPRGTLSPAQKDFADRLSRSGTQLHVTRSFQESRTLITAWLANLDEKAAAAL